MPVSAVRCCDWKNTASVSPHLGQGLLDLGSCSWKATSQRAKLQGLCSATNDFCMM